MSSNPSNLVTTQLNVNSLARLNYLNTDSSNYRIDLAHPLIGRIKSFSLKTATIPNTIYNIISPVNVLLFTDSVGDTSITIPPGNYSLDQLVIVIEDLLNATTDVYTITYNQNTGKITITSTFAGFTLLPGNTSLSDRGEIFSSPPSLNYQLGFAPLTTYVSTGGVLDAPNVPTLQGLGHVYIRLKQFKQFYKNTVNTFFTFDVPMYETFTGINYYTEGNGCVQKYSMSDSNTYNIGFLDVELLNVFGNRVNLNGSDWGFVIEFELNEA